VPEVAGYQDWPMPFTPDDARAMLAAQDGAADVVVGGWVQIAIEHEGRVVGDVAVGLTSPWIAQLGYTMSPEHQGRGFASEAAGAIVDALFATDEIHRITASLDPRNAPSMRVVEQLGFRWEGTAYESELIRGEWLDDMRFGLLRRERESWLARPRHRPNDVRLVEIEPGAARSWAQDVTTHHFQRSFVAPVLDSFADALHPPVIDGEPLVPWYRGIEADGERVGFVMMAEVSPSNPDPYLWRLLIDRRHQRRGIAGIVLRRLIDELRGRGCTRLVVSYVEAPGGPEPLYRGLGFVPTGEMEGDETVAALTL
jgi:RimJ/RimL family protein N-acetyltransferase